MPSTKPHFSLRLAPDLRVRAEGRAVDLGISLNALVAVALDTYLNGGTPRRAPEKRIAPEEFAGVSRNALCPCGSGRKYKRCHGA